MRRIVALMLLVAVAQFASLGCRSSQMVTGKCDCGEFPGEAVHVVGKPSYVAPSATPASMPNIMPGSPIQTIPSPLPTLSIPATSQLPQGF